MTVLLTALLVLLIGLGFANHLFWLAAAALLYFMVKYRDELKPRSGSGSSGSGAAGGGGGAGAGAGGSGGGGGGGGGGGFGAANYHAYRVRRDRMERWDRRYRRTHPTRRS
ncbi:hypothetical protein [Streptomyces sp. NPDC059009]|uniref:hypothetical protein n=1 Tax=Streptomyces sp. NPDC059009 TaxID=3346694 RepID=UPI0036A1E7E8